MVSCATGGSREASAPDDEFDVSTGSSPPAIPEGFKTKGEYDAAAAAGKLDFVGGCDSTPLPDGVVELKNVPYGQVGDKTLLLDLYHPAQLEKPAPALIIIHGGPGYREMGCRAFYRHYGVRYAKRGYVVACVYYRYPEQYPFPAPLQDVKCAVRWMRAHAKDYKVNPNSIGAMGIATGGYLAMMLGYTTGVAEFEGDGGWEGLSSQVQAVANLYGPSDLTHPDIRNAPIATELIGKQYDESITQYELASPIRYINNKTVPTLVIHGAIDTTVPVAQSDRLVARLRESGVSCQYEKFEGWPEWMDRVVPVSNCCQWFMNRWFEKYLN